MFRRQKARIQVRGDTIRGTCGRSRWRTELLKHHQSRPLTYSMLFALRSIQEGRRRSLSSTYTGREGRRRAPPSGRSGSPRFRQPIEMSESAPFKASSIGKFKRTRISSLESCSWPGFQDEGTVSQMDSKRLRGYWHHYHSRHRICPNIWGLLEKQKHTGSKHDDEEIVSLFGVSDDK